MSLLLVFVFAYFSALFPLFESLRRQPKPSARDDQEELARRLATYRLLGYSLLLVVTLVLTLLGPLCWRVLHSELWNPFQTLRVGLLLLEVLLVATGIAVTIEIVLLTKRVNNLR